MGADLELLNAQDHADLRIAASAPARPHFVQIVVEEFAAAAAVCPIFLAKSPDTGRFYAGAMFGFQPGENLVDQEADAARLFQPLDLERQGFFIVSGNEIGVDRDHPRFSQTGGAALFEPDGAPSHITRRVQRALGQLHSGIAETDAFIQALLDHKLVEPIDIDLSFDDGATLSLNGLYTISLDALGRLDDAAILKLFRAGHLQSAYAMTGSLKQLSRLAQRRNALIGA